MPQKSLCCNLQNCLSCCIIFCLTVNVLVIHWCSNFKSTSYFHIRQSQQTLSTFALLNVQLCEFTCGAQPVGGWGSSSHSPFVFLLDFIKWHISSSSCRSSVFVERPKLSWWPLWKCRPRSPDTLLNTRGRALHSSAAVSPHPATNTRN